MARIKLRMRLHFRLRGQNVLAERTFALHQLEVAAEPKLVWLPGRSWLWRLGLWCLGRFRFRPRQVVQVNRLPSEESNQCRFAWVVTPGGRREWAGHDRWIHNP